MEWIRHELPAGNQGAKVDCLNAAMKKILAVSGACRVCILIPNCKTWGNLDFH